MDLRHFGAYTDWFGIGPLLIDSTIGGSTILIIEFCISLCVRRICNVCDLTLLTATPENIEFAPS